jgi:hypothetical protein
VREGRAVGSETRIAYPMGDVPCGLVRGMPAVLDFAYSVRFVRSVS